MRKKILPLLGALTALTCNSMAAAQMLEEIVVTAQKREQSLQDVSVSVAVISGKELAALNKTQISELTRLVPGLTYSGGTSDAGQSIILRGIGTQTFSRSVDQSVGTVIDGVVSSSVSGSLLDFSDVERVEVLRGPQGMLFGKNASAGVLSITTQAPTQELSAGLGMSYGDENDIQLNGYLSGPLVENTLLARVSAYNNTRDGILANEFPGADDMNDRDEWGVRAKLHWLASDDLDVRFAYNHVEREHNCCIAPLGVVTPGSIADREGGERGPKADTIVDNDASPGRTQADVYSVEANLQWGDFLLTSITAYTEEDIFASARSDLYTRTALPLNDSFGHYEQFTQELRLTSAEDQTISYVAGLYYFDKKIDREFERIISLNGIDLAPAGEISVLNYADTENESFAIFGQATWHITERARVSLGARYNDEELSIDQTVGFFPGTAPEAPPGEISDETDDQQWSGRLISELDITPSAMVYASVARGYKGPGSNSLPSGPSSDSVFVDPEIPTNYELGIKSEWLDNRVRLNGAVYYTEFEDFQASAQVPDAFPPLFFLANAGELETKGVELEMNAQLLPNLAVQASVAYTDAIFSDWTDAPCYSEQTEELGCVDGVQDLSGADMPSSPDWAFNVGANYFLSIPSQPFNAFVRGNYFWQDEVQFDTTNNPLYIGDAYGTLDLYVGIADESGRYSAQFFMLNALDEFYVSSLSGQQIVGIEVANGLAYTYKRRLGVSLRVDF